MKTLIFSVFCGFDGSVFGVAESAIPKTDPAQVLQLCTKLAWTWLKHCACAAIFLYCFNGFQLKTLIFLLFFVVLMVLFLEWLNQPLQKQTRLKHCNWNSPGISGKFREIPGNSGNSGKFREIPGNSGKFQLQCLRRACFWSG